MGTIFAFSYSSRSEPFGFSASTGLSNAIEGGAMLLSIARDAAYHTSLTDQIGIHAIFTTSSGQQLIRSLFWERIKIE
jgi:hypothetical protein